MIIIYELRDVEYSNRMKLLKIEQYQNKNDRFGLFFQPLFFSVLLCHGTVINKSHF